MAEPNDTTTEAPNTNVPDDVAGRVAAAKERADELATTLEALSASMSEIAEKIPGARAPSRARERHRRLLELQEEADKISRETEPSMNIALQLELQEKQVEHVEWIRRRLQARVGRWFIDALRHEGAERRRILEQGLHVAASVLAWDRRAAESARFALASVERALDAEGVPDTDAADLVVLGELVDAGPIPDDLVAHVRASRQDVIGRLLEHRDAERAMQTAGA